MAKDRTLKLNLLTDTTKFNAGIKSATGQVGQMDSTIGSMSKKATAAFAALAASAGYAALRIGKDAVKAALEDQKSQRVLELQLQKTVKANAAVTASVDDYINKTSMRVGIQDDVLRPSFARLIRSTEDVKTAQDALNLALDISAATGKDVDTVTAALGKAYDGNTASLGRLGLGIDKAVLSSGNLNQIIGTLKGSFGGFADKEANTLEGKIRRLGVATDELKESIGYMLLPAVSDFVTFANSQLIPTIERIRDGFQGTAKDSTDAASTFGMSLGYFRDEVSRLISNFGGASNVMDSFFLLLSGRIGTISRALESLNKVVEVAKKLLGIKTAAAAVSNASMQTRDTMRSEGRNVDQLTQKYDALTTAIDKLNTKKGGLSKADKKRKAELERQREAERIAAEQAQAAEDAAREAARQQEETLQAVTGAFKSYSDSVEGAITSNFSFADAFKSKGQGSFMESLRNQAAQAREFGGRIARLVSLGLSRGALSQVLAAGPIVGSQIADELIQSGVGEANQLVGDLSSFAGMVGNLATTGVSGGAFDPRTGNGINITINGAIDPEGVRRSLESLFQQSGARIGDVNFAGANL